MTDRAHLFSVICSVFTYLVVGCCFYYFRTLEFLLGSYIYLTFLFSSSVCILLIHFLQLWIYDPGYGCISLICALLVVYWSISYSSSLRLEIVPSIKNASTVVYKSISVSEKAILLFLSIALALTCGLAGVLESIIGCGIGYGLLCSYQKYHHLLRLPQIISKSIAVLLHIVSLRIGHHWSCFWWYGSRAQLQRRQFHSLLPLPSKSAPITDNYYSQCSWWFDGYDTLRMLVVGNGLFQNGMWESVDRSG